jgi:cytoskeletal protein CcmA (bactofilin family)
MERSRAIIGADAKFVGKISNVKSIEIEGTVEADLAAEKLSIGASGRFTGQVKSDLVVIGGAYDGIMQAGSIWATETAQTAGLYITGRNLTGSSPARQRLSKVKMIRSRSRKAEHVSGTLLQIKFGPLSRALE